jgi:hypothetical protein
MVLSRVEGPRRPWPQYTMIQNEVDPGPRDQDGQPLQQFEGIEQKVRGAIGPRVPELQHDLPLGRQTEPVLRDGRPQRVPAVCGPRSYADHAPTWSGGTPRMPPGRRSRRG